MNKNERIAEIHLIRGRLDSIERYLDPDSSFVSDLLDTTLRMVDQLLMNMTNGRVEIEAAEARSEFLQRRLYRIMEEYVPNIDKRDCDRI